MTTRKQEEGFWDETLVAPDQTTIQGQKSLTDLLDEIEQPLVLALCWGSCHCAVCKSHRGKLALVKALRFATDEFQRMANEEIERVAHAADFANRNIAELLREPAERESCQP